MKNSEEYKGCLIEALPEELADGSGWHESCVIKLSRFEGIWLGSDRKYPTSKAAAAASILNAKRRIDGFNARTGDGTESHTDLSATWKEGDDVRPTIQGDPEPFLDGGVRWIKDKRRPGLDRIDGEPE